MTLDEFQKLTLGDFGSVIVADTTTTPGRFGALVVITETVISAIVAPRITGASSLDGLTLAAGTVILGQINSIKLTSGVVQMINRQLP